LLNKNRNILLTVNHYLGKQCRLRIQNSIAILYRGVIEQNETALNLWWITGVTVQIKKKFY